MYAVSEIEIGCLTKNSDDVAFRVFGQCSTTRFGYATMNAIELHDDHTTMDKSNPRQRGYLFGFNGVPSISARWPSWL